MRILRRVARILKGLFLNSVNNLENKNIDALILNLEDEKEKAQKDIFDRLVKVKTSINEMSSKVSLLEDKLNEQDKRARLALENGKETLAAEFALQYENTKVELDTLTKALVESQEIYDKLIEKQRSVINSYDMKISQIKLKAATSSINEELASLKDISNFSDKNNFNGLLNDVDKILDKKNAKATASIEVSEALEGDKEEFNTELESLSKEEALSRLKSRLNNENESE